MSDLAAGLAQAIDERRAVIGVVGLGYIGLPVAGAFVDAGFRVLGFDRDPTKLERLAAGQDYLAHVGEGFAAGLLASGRFMPCADRERMGAADVLVLCVPTPLTADRKPDLGAVKRTAGDVAASLRPGQLVVLESTTYPGTTREVVLPILEGPPRAQATCGVRGVHGDAPDGDRLHGGRGAGGDPVPGAGSDDGAPGGATGGAPADVAPAHGSDGEGGGEAGETAGGWRPRLGHDLFLAYAPERVDPGRSEPPLTAVPRLVGGLDAPSRDLAVRLYAAAYEQVVPVSSVEVAEAAKLLENVYRAVNIALVNELKTLLLAMDVDVAEVIDAAATKPYGFHSFRPGPGLGGHCLPIDPFYLAHKARELGLPARFVELAGEVNRDAPLRVVERTVLALSERGVAIRGARVLVLGLAYKPDVDDTRESPSFAILQELLRRGARADYHDPWVPVTRPVRHAELPPMTSVPLDPGVYDGYDAVLIATDHSAVDYDRLAREARLVIDTRGVMRGRGGEVVVA